MTEFVSALPIELTFYCMLKVELDGECQREYTCIVPSDFGSSICRHLVAKSDREIFDRLQEERAALKEAST